MSVLIGPSFARELAAAGVSMEGFSWGPDGVIEFREDVPQAVRDQVADVLAAHDPTAPAPDTTLSDGLARPEIQAILGLIAEQQGTTVEALQEQAVAAGMARKAGVAIGSPKQ